MGLHDFVVLGDGVHQAACNLKPSLREDGIMEALDAVLSPAQVFSLGDIKGYG